MNARHRQLLPWLVACVAIGASLPLEAAPLSVTVADGEQPFTVKTQILVLMSLLGLIPIVSKVRC